MDGAQEYFIIFSYFFDRIYKNKEILIIKLKLNDNSLIGDYKSQAYSNIYFTFRA